MLDLACLVPCEATAEWRRRKQEQYPDDQRNGRAADILDSLEKEISALEGGVLHKRIEELWFTKQGFSDVVGEELRSVGFYWSPNAPKLLESIIGVLEIAPDNEPGE